MSLILSSVAYTLGVILALCILAEACTFLDPATYEAFAINPQAKFHVAMLKLILGVAHLLLKIVGFQFAVCCTLLVVGVNCVIHEINTREEWGVVMVFVTATRCFAWRCAVAKDSWVVRGLVLGVWGVGRGLELWTRFMDGIMGG